MESFNSIKREMESSGPFVAFGFNSIKRDVARLGGYSNLTAAKTKAVSSKYYHSGVAKVTHPQKIRFYQSGRGFIALSDDAIWDVITLLGI